MGSRRQLCGQAGLSLSSGNTTSTSSGSNNNSTRLIHLCRRQAAEQHRKRVEHFQPQQQQSPAHSGISVNSNSSFILNSKNNTHEDMRQEDQVKTTSASRALFSSTRLWVRDQILPYVVAETPYIMEMQAKYRSPLMDKFMMTVSFVGSHVFYMLFLPMTFWLGYARFGRLLAFVLATSLYTVNIVKDLLCLPRPMSPPVVKLSSDYKMEYGFPSAHAVNSLNIAVSFAYYYCNYSDPVPSLLQQTAAWACALTFLGLICISRVYCGMHTVTDIVGGLSLGLVLQLTFIAYFPMLDFWMMTSNNVMMYSVAAAICMLWLYPDPVDPTPSFDDAMSFIWVIAGVASGMNFFASTKYSDNAHYLGGVHYSFDSIGVVNTLLRLAVGVAVVMAWRFVAKAVLQKALPPIYRAFEFLPKRRGVHKKSGSLSTSIVAQLGKRSEHLAGHRRSDSNGSDEDNKKYAFHRIPRYDVDVVTRGFVYFGIGYASVCIIPILFDYLSLSS